MAIKDLSQTQMNTLASSGARHPKTGGRFIAQGEQPFDLSVNNQFFHLGQASAGWLQVRKSDANNTTARVIPGPLILAGVSLDFFGGLADLAALNNDTAYLWLYHNAGVAALGFGAESDGWPMIPHFRLATVTLAAGGFEESDIVDLRPETFFRMAAGVADIAAPLTATATQVANKVNELLASLRAARLIA